MTTMFGRSNRSIRQAVHSHPYRSAASVSVAYPRIGDWRALYDPDFSKSDRAVGELYDDMRRHHERTVAEQLDLVAKQATGSAVLADLSSRASYSVMILPFDFLPAPSWNLHVAAVTRATEPTAEWVAGARMCGTSLTSKAYCSHSTGTGSGSSADIYYTVGRQKHPDETLAHELMHATRKVRGIVHRMATDSGYGNLEEFLAVVVENMYRSEKGRPLYDYHHHRIDPAKFLDSDVTPSPRLLLGLMRANHPTLFEALAALSPGKPSFNPMRQVADAAKAAEKKAAGV